jgi:hypothetical protein
LLWPFVYDNEPKNVAAEHPVIAQLVQSGRIVDTNIYRNYFYETARSYSKRGWFIIGDAGDTVDPLYSTGISMTSIQINWRPRRPPRPVPALERAGEAEGAEPV